MSLVADPIRMTFEEFLALPDDGVERDLIDGMLWEDDPSVTKRNRWHSRSEAQLSFILEDWLRRNPACGSQIVSGEAGFRLGDGTGVGIDVAYVSAEVIAVTPDDEGFFQGAPVLAVEILSPSDRHGRTIAKIRALLKAGAAAVWIVDPAFRTVAIYRNGVDPVMVNLGQDLSGEDYLPGFQVPLVQVLGT
ncbi:MAG: hypothetical protein JWN86_3508 [Planctomycetota bacterium]|nr:hypothetical protein [Planctomycetota bacterium]